MILSASPACYDSLRLGRTDESRSAKRKVRAPGEFRRLRRNPCAGRARASSAGPWALSAYTVRGILSGRSSTSSPAPGGGRGSVHSGRRLRGHGLVRRGAARRSVPASRAFRVGGSRAAVAGDPRAAAGVGALRVLRVRSAGAIAARSRPGRAPVASCHASAVAGRRRATGRAGESAGADAPGADSRADGDGARPALQWVHAVVAQIPDPPVRELAVGGMRAVGRVGRQAQAVAASLSGPDRPRRVPRARVHFGNTPAPLEVGERRLRPTEVPARQAAVEVPCRG